MITANELITFKQNASDAESAAERKRIAQLLCEVQMLAKEEKVTLVEELISIVENRADDLIMRVQAATILANSCGELDLIGGTNIAQRLVGVLRREFIPVVTHWGGENQTRRSVFLCSLEFLEVLLFRHLAHAIFRIDLKEAELLFKEIGPFVEGSDIACCIDNLMRSKHN
jgi:hypothetical protein